MPPTDLNAQANGITNLSLAWRLLKLGVSHKRPLAAALLVTILMQLMTVGELISSGLAIDVLRSATDASAPTPEWPLGWAPPARWSMLGMLAIAAGAAMLFAILRSVGYYLTRLTDELVAQEVIVDLRDKVYQQLQALPFSFFDRNDSGTIINRVTTDVQSVRIFIQGVLLRAITALVTLIVFLITMLTLHVGLTIACSALGIVQIIVVARYAKRARPAFREQRLLLDGVISKLAEGVQGIRVVRAFGRDREQMRAFADASQEARDQRNVIWKLTGNHMPLIMGVSWVQVAVLIGYGGILVQRGPDAGGLALGAIWVFFGLLRTLSVQIEQIIRVASALPESLTGAERVFAILDADPEIVSPLEGTVAQVSPAATQRGSIEFRNVTFGFDAGRPVLHNINLHIRPGERVALLGPVASGKSALLQLVPRFYDPQQGQVLVGGVDVREQNLHDLRRSIGMVFQEPFLFSNTIKDNIAFGRHDAEHAAVRDAASQAQAATFIEQLPKQYETIIGERGMMLSGGERQRLTLSRALLIQPAILLLDDVMSAVDAGTEDAILTALDDSSREITMLIVAHRLSTLRRMDRIIVIEDGRIAAEGRHDDLMQHVGHYREAARVQMTHEQDAEHDDDHERADEEWPS